jgi:hypothetical protein
VSNLLKNKNNFFLIVALIFFVIAPNLRPIFKYSNFFQSALFIIYALFVIVLVYLLHKNKFKFYFSKWLGNYWFVFFIFLLVSLLIWFLYPIADGLKSQMRGSDQDDCVIIGVKQLVSLLHPYDKTSYLGNPCSTGLGIILLYSPFVLLNIYCLASIFLAYLCTYVIRGNSRNVYITSIFTILQFSSLFSMELLIVGSDLIFVGFGLVLLSFQTINLVLKKNTYNIFWLAAFAGLLSSSRINFLVIAPIISIFIFIHWQRGGLLFGLYSISVAIVPSTILYFVDSSKFTPFHLLEKSNLLLQGGLKELAIFLSIVAFLFSCNLIKKSIKLLPISLLLCLLPSLLSLSFADLFLRKVNFAMWEGANYLAPILPLSFAIISHYIIKSNKN